MHASFFAVLMCIVHANVILLLLQVGDEESQTLLDKPDYKPAVTPPTSGDGTESSRGEMVQERAYQVQNLGKLSAKQRFYKARAHRKSWRVAGWSVDAKHGGISRQL